MSCEIWREALSARLDGEALPPGAELLDEHLTTCGPCIRYRDELETVNRSTRIRTAEPVPDLTDLILEQARSAPTLPRHRPWPRLIGAAAAAATLVIGLIGWQATRTEPSLPPELRFASAYATVTPDGGNASVYLSLTNDGGPDNLVSADTTIARRTSLHGSDYRDGYVLMSTRDEYPVPGNTTITFQPGGAHVMLEGLDEPLTPGDRFRLTLRFVHSPAIEVTATVVPMTEIVDLVGFDPAVTEKGR